MATSVKPKRTSGDGIVDGRTARRDRGRSAVIDAVFDLMQEGRVPPDVNELAARSGVSVSSIFRYFDGLEDIQVQALIRFRERFGHLFEVSVNPPQVREERIIDFVSRRLALMDEVGLVLVIARVRALERDHFVDASESLRGSLAAQVRGQFVADLRTLTAAQTDALVSAIDSFASPAAWTVMQDTHTRTSRQIKSTWIKGIGALLEAWSPLEAIDLGDLEAAVAEHSTAEEATGEPHE